MITEAGGSQPWAENMVTEAPMKESVIPGPVVENRRRLMEKSSARVNIIEPSRLARWVRFYLLTHN